MRKIFNYIVIFTLIIVIYLFISCKNDNDAKPYYLGNGEYNGEYFPTISWRMCTPESVGMNSVKLKKVYSYAANRNINTKGILVIKNGYIVLEAYFKGYTEDSKYESYSIAKSFTSALIGIALEKGFIENLDKKIGKYYSELNASDVDPRKKRITVKNLLSMMSGITWQEEGEYSHSEDDAFLMMDYSDYSEYVLSKPMKYEPGTEWYYSSGDTVLLSGVIEEATGMTLFDFGRKYLFDYIGLENINWDSDSAGHTIGAWGIHATLREYAKFGYLYLQKGKWEGVRIVPEKWINESLKPVFPPKIDFYGYQWWLGRSFENFTYYGLPDDIYLAWGLYTQQIFIIPSHQMVVVRFGRDPYSSYDQWDEAEFISLLLKADS